MKATKDWHEKLYASQGFGAQRRFPNEELLRFMGVNFFGIDAALRKQMKMLEIGCGSGANLWMIAREGFETFGLDLSNEALKLCETMLTSWGTQASLQQGSMTGLPYASEMFDGVVDVFSSYCLNEAEFLDCLDDVARVLKSGGRYFSYAPSKNSDAFTDFLPAKKIDPSTIDGIARPTAPYYGNSYPFRFIDGAEYASALEKRGLVITSNERISRTYRRGEEYFEFVSIAARKT